MLKQWLIRVPGIQSLLYRALMIAGLACYVVLFNYLYINWLAPSYSYMGMTYHEPPLSLLVLGWGLALLPALWMPVSLRRPSELPFWFLYLMVYIPSLFVPSYMALESRNDLVTLMFCLIGGFGIISLTYLLRPVNTMRIELSGRLFWSLIIAITMLLDVWVVWVYHSQMHLVGFNDVYELRWAADRTAQGTGVEYATMLLSSVIDPLYMVFGLISKKKTLVLLGFLEQLLVYSAEGSKAVILSLVVILAIYSAIGRSGRLFSLRLIGSIVSLLFLLTVFAVQGNVNPVIKFAMFLVFGRTVANGGYTTAEYANFFHTHPLTHLSTVHGIDRLVHYPYSDPLGVVIGIYESGNPELDLNAHLWASDGIAAFGVTGILWISVGCLLVFWILDCAAAKHSVVLASLMVAFITINLTNVSLFTTMISGGLGLAILLLFIMPSTQRTAFIQDAETSIS